MHIQVEQLQGILATGWKKPGRKKQNGMSDVMALHLDFVARPGSRSEWMNELAQAIENARLEGLQACVVLVSDREARLVTLLTFWERRRFLAAREHCIAWMQKLLARFADGPIRARCSVPHFFDAETSEGAPERLLDGTETRFREVVVD